VARKAENLKTWYFTEEEETKSLWFTTPNLAEGAEVVTLKYMQINILAK